MGFSEFIELGDIYTFVYIYYAFINFHLKILELKGSLMMAYSINTRTIPSTFFSLELVSEDDVRRSGAGAGNSNTKSTFIHLLKPRI